MRWLRRRVDEWRPSALTLGAPLFPLIVLFGLNTVDELDRAAFAVLLPEIRDHFQLGDAEALSIVSLSTIAVLLLEDEVDVDPVVVAEVEDRRASVRPLPLRTKGRVRRRRRSARWTSGR